MGLVCHHNPPPASRLTADAAATAGISTSVAHPLTKPCLCLSIITSPLALLFPHFQCSLVYSPSLVVHTSLFHAVIMSVHTERKKEAVVEIFVHRMVAFLVTESFFISLTFLLLS
jgi:hypothetical protein